MSKVCPVDPFITFDKETRRTKISSEKIRCVQFFLMTSQSIYLREIMVLESRQLWQLAKHIEVWHTFEASVIKKIDVIHHFEIYASMAAKKICGLSKKYYYRRNEILNRGYWSFSPQVDQPTFTLRNRECFRIRMGAYRLLARITKKIELTKQRKNFLNIAVLCCSKQIPRRRLKLLP